MLATVFILQLLLWNLLASASPLAPRQTAGPIGPTNFRLVAGSYPGTQPPNLLSGPLKISPTTGAAIIDRSTGAKGFVSYVDPAPKGLLHTTEDGKIGHLFPLFETPGLYELHFSANIPKIAGLLFAGFYANAAGCGGHCGGYMLNYDETLEDDLYRGQWAWTKSEEGPVVRWWNGKEGLPKGHQPIYIRRDAA